MVKDQQEHLATNPVRNGPTSARSRSTRLMPSGQRSFDHKPLLIEEKGQEHDHLAGIARSSALFRAPGFTAHLLWILAAIVFFVWPFMALRISVPMAVLATHDG